jgi:hypothetical protein
MNADDAPGSFDELISLVSELPQILEEVEIILASDQATTPSTASNLLQSLIRFYGELVRWKELFNSRLDHKGYWAVPAKLHNPSDERYSDKLYPFALEFVSLDISMLFTFGAGVMLQVLTTILQIDKHVHYFESQATAQHRTIDSLSLNEFTRKFESETSIREEANNVARLVCLSVEYCLRKDMGTLGPQCLCHAQWVSRRYFYQSRLNRELDWCLNIKNLSGPDSRCGIDIMLLGDPFVQ